MFAYCGNNPVRRSDPLGHSWITDIIEKFKKALGFDDSDGTVAGVVVGSVMHGIGKGWKYRIDPPHTPKTQRHIHIEHGKDEYIQNDDGSGSHTGKGAKGKIPEWVNDYLKENEGWDYNGNRDSFYNKTTIAYTDNGNVYSYADGTIIIIQPVRVFGYLTMPVRDTSVDDLEGIYFSNANGNWANSDSSTVPIPLVPTTPITVPGIGPVAIPVFG